MEPGRDGRGHSPRTRVRGFRPQCPPVAARGFQNRGEDGCALHAPSGRVRTLHLAERDGQHSEEAYPAAVWEMTSTRPLAVIVMGVAGSGKTTVGKLLAERMHCSF